ncbi:hypothetical protein JCM8208_003579 [Rhodotorula glutinis]
MTKQPPNPLLPSPRLPTELIVTILGHLEHVEPGDEPRQRRIGSRIARVGRAWLQAGRRIACAHVAMEWNDDYLARHLLKHPDLRKEVCALFFHSDKPSYTSVASASSRRSAVIMVELIEKCSPRLKTLHFQFPVDGLDLWTRITSSAVASTLRELNISAGFGSEDALLHLLGGLAVFIGLEELNIFIEDLPEWDPTVGYSELVPKANARGGLPVRTFSFWHNVVESIPSLVVGNLLASLLDTKKLSSLELRLGGYGAEHLEWVGAFRRLTSIFLSAAHIEPLVDELPFFVDAISSLPRIRRGFIDPEPGKDERNGTALVPSPVPLADLLDKVPPCIELYCIGGGVFFNEDLNLPLASDSDSQEPDVRLQLSLKLKSAKKARPVELVGHVQSNDLILWSIGPKRSFSDDEHADASPPPSACYEADDERDDERDEAHEQSRAPTELDSDGSG